MNNQQQAISTAADNKNRQITANGLSLCVTRLRLRSVAKGDIVDKNVVKTILCERLRLAKIPFQRQGNQIQTASACILFQSQALVLKKPGKAERQLPYHKVRISQLLWQLHDQTLPEPNLLQEPKAAPTTFLQA